MLSLATSPVVFSTSDAPASRAALPLADAVDYTYTLSGTQSDGTPVTDVPVTFSADGSALEAYVLAGTYTLAADNFAASQEGSAAPYYSGTSANFTVLGGESTTVTLDLGAPRNARIDLTYADTFTALYENPSLTLTSDGTKRTLSGLDATTAYVMVPADSGTATVTYTLRATAKAGSHVSDLPAEGLSANLTLQAGHAYPLTITGRSISDQLIEFGNGEHTGPFDAQHK